MGRFGWRSGNVKAQNIQSGNSDVTTDSNGDGTLVVVFKNKMRAIPTIGLTAQEADITGTLAITAKTVNGFTITVDGSSVTSGVLTVGWQAMDDSDRA